MNKIIENKPVGKNIFLMTIEAHSIAKNSKPGQFVNVRVSNSFKPLLRRPFSVYSADGDNFKILYKIVGEGTEILSKYKSGDEVDVIGPLGNYFDADGKNILLVAGGIGIAPLHFFIERNKNSNVILLMGAKTKSELIFDNYSCDVIFATEDGSYGKKCLVTDLLFNTKKPDVIFTCGPISMIKYIKDYCEKNKIHCQVSIEQHMACGMGFCLGCAIKTKYGYKYVCKDGPIFNVEELELGTVNEK